MPPTATTLTVAPASNTGEAATASEDDATAETRNVTKLPGKS